MTADNLLDDIRREFKKLDVNNKSCLNVQQIGQLFKNVGIDIPEI